MAHSGGGLGDEVNALEPENLPRVLCVDDDLNLLEGLRRGLAFRYDIATAPSGLAGLEQIATQPTFAVVISDMRMPEMNGAEFLSRVREASPTTVRVLLTGYSDVQAATEAINRGQIFRFLTKPCAPDALAETIEAALEQHRLITAERVLLEQTLSGSIKALMDVLALTSPQAFGRATRVKRLVANTLERLEVESHWAIEVAAMLSQVPCVTLPTDTIERLYSGGTLSKSEQTMVEKLPAIAESLFSSIPRLEPVLEILRYQQFGLTDEKQLAVAEQGTPPVGARLLKIAQDFDTLHNRGLSGEVALEKMRRETPRYDDALLAIFSETHAEQAAQATTRHLPLRDVQVGMIFVEDVTTREGMLIVSSGHEATAPLLQRLTNFAVRAGLREPLAVSGGPKHSAKVRTKIRIR